MWTAVRQLLGRQHEETAVDGVTAESLNDHYAAISTDNSYIAPIRKHPDNSTVSDYLSSWNVFHILDHLHPTATGLD